MQKMWLGGKLIFTKLGGEGIYGLLSFQSRGGGGGKSLPRGGKGPPPHSPS